MSARRARRRPVVLVDARREFFFGPLGRSQSGPRRRGPYKDLVHQSPRMQIIRPRRLLGKPFLVFRGDLPRDLFPEDRLERFSRPRRARDSRISGRLMQAPEHPVSLSFPEGEYLRASWCRLLCETALRMALSRRGGFLRFPAKAVSGESSGCAEESNSAADIPAGKMGHVHRRNLICAAAAPAASGTLGLVPEPSQSASVSGAVHVAVETVVKSRRPPRNEEARSSLSISFARNR